jgi:hypothetical protein
VLLNGFAAGGAVGVDELFGSPKPNKGFDDESDAAGSTGGLDGVTLTGLPVVSPKLNFGFSTSPVPLAGRVLVLGLESLLVGFGGFEGCENEKKLGVVFEPFPCGADETFEMEAFDGAFGCPKEKIEEFVELFASGTDDGAVVGCEFGVKKLGTVGLDEIVPLAAGVGAEVKLERAGLDGARPLAAGRDAGVCVVGIGAEGKEKVPGAVAGVLPSDLSFTSLGCELEDSVGILNNDGGLEGSVFCELPFENGGRENADVAVGGATEGLSSDFADRTVGRAGAVATFFASASLASASAFAFSFSSALRRRRAIASASISCFSHFEYELDGRNLGLISADFTAGLVYNDEMRRVYWGGGARGNNAIRGLAIKEWVEMRILRTGLPVFDVEAQRSCLPALDEFRCEKSDQLGNITIYNHVGSHTERSSVVSGSAKGLSESCHANSWASFAATYCSSVYHRSTIAVTDADRSGCSESTG